jgi:hypothetical protein
MFCLVRCVARNDRVDATLADGRTDDPMVGPPPSRAGRPRSEPDEGEGSGLEDALDDEDLATLSAVATCLLGGGVL